MANAIGDDLTPVYIDSNGIPKPCRLSLHDRTRVTVVNKGNNEEIASITVDGTTVVIKNFKPPLCKVRFLDGSLPSTDPKYVIFETNILSGADAVPPTPPEHLGKSFIRWDGKYTAVTSDVDIVAIYENVNTFNVKFYRYGKAPEPTLDINVNEGTVPTAPTVVMRGWLFDGWVDNSGYPYGNPINQDTVYHARWRKVYNNLMLTTPSTEPSGSSLGTGSIYSFFSLDSIANLELPVGGEVQVTEAYGLLNHDGDSTKHHLLMAPCYMSSANGDDDFKAQNVTTETYNKLKDDRSGTEVVRILNPSWKLAADSKDKTKSTACNWKTTDGEDFGPVNGGVWKSYSRIDCRGSVEPAKSNIVLAADIDFNKTSGTSTDIITMEYDTCCHDVATHAIPAKIGSYDVARLCIALIKITSGCTVPWRMFIQKLCLTLW